MRVAIGLMVIAVLLCGAVVIACGEKEPVKSGSTASQPAPKAPEPAPKPPEPKPEPKPEPPAPEPKPEPKPEPPAPEPKPEPPAPEPKPEPAGDQLSPWGQCKVGDWVKFKGMNDMTMTHELVKVGDKTVTVKMTTDMPGMPAGSIPAQEMEQPKFVATGGAPAMPGPAPVMEDLGTETLDIGGKKIECKVSRVKMEAMGKTVTSKTWMSDAIPGGLVKTESDMMGSMQVTMEAIDFKKQ